MQTRKQLSMNPLIFDSLVKSGFALERAKRGMAGELRRVTLADKLSMLSYGGKFSRQYKGFANSSGQMTQQQLNDLNLSQRAAILQYAIEMTQALPSQNQAGTITANNNQFTFNLRNVGLAKKLIIEISGTYNNTDAAAAATATAFGLANLISNIQLVDLSNNTRISTIGAHLAILKQVKHKTSDPGSAPIGTAQSDAMVAGEFVASGSAPNFPVIVYPLPAHGVSSAFRAVFELPICYSDEDLRGAMYLNVVNAVAQAVITLNPNASPAGTDNTLAVWGTAAGNISNVTLTCYQVFLDQLPTDQNGKVILPTLDLSTVYELKSTNLTALSVGQDFPIPYANFRDFLSTLLIFNSTNATAGLKNGSDVNYFSLQSANFTNIWKIDPLLAAQRTREIIMNDLPLGTYYFSHRKKPISTLQYGNMQMNLNPATLSAGAYVLVNWEDFAMVNTVTQAGSLAG